MEGSLGGLLPQGIALLVGGLVASLGPTLWARTARGRASLLRARTGPLLAALGGGAVISVGTAIWIGRSLARSVLTDSTPVGVWPLLALGAAVGLPMSLPGLLAVRSEARRRDRKRRDRVPTKADRRAYAADLVRQIVEVSPEPRSLTAAISGDGGTVLRFEGDIDAAEGERLTAALREDLKDVGFKRVEGAKGAKEWWSRV